MAAPGDVEKPQAASVQCPDTTIAAHRTATEDYRAASLSNARKVVLEDIGHFVIAPDSYLWDLYPVPHNFEAIMQYLTEEGWLTSDRDWDPKRISRADIEQRKVGFIEQEVFEPLAKIFNAVLSYKPSNSKVLGMVNAGSHPLKSDRISTNRPDAYLAPQSLQANPSAKGPKVPKRRLWRDATCPFEYKFGDGDKDDNHEKLIWSLHHLLRCDPRRSFSFGGTIEGGFLTIWLCCRAALFQLQRFDWIEKPELLVRFFIILAFSSESDLGIDTGIERLDHDFELRFEIDKTKYRVSKVLFDVGADATCSSGTRVFRVIDETSPSKIYRVVKDSWVEQREGGRCPEHEIVQTVRNALGDECFNNHFVNTLGHCFIRNPALDNICKILSSRKPDGGVPYSVEPLNPQYRGRGDHEKVYTSQSTTTVVDQLPFLTPTLRRAESRPFHPRLRYQVVYEEEGKSLYQVAPPLQIFRSLENVVKGLHHLHSRGFVHRDIHPGNVIIVDGVAKVSDMEFVKERNVTALREATMRAVRSPFRRLTEVRTGSVHFTAIEVAFGRYLFSSEDSTPQKAMDSLLQEADPNPHTGKENPGGKPKRIFLHNPLHDYESVWWIATWTLFGCQPKSLEPEGSEDRRMRAMEEIFGNHRTTVMVVGGPFESYKESLPDALHPLFDALEVFRGVLTMAYQDYEKSFDGSTILSKTENFRKCLTVLAERADKVELCDLPTLQPPPLSRSLAILEESEETSVEGQGDEDGASDNRLATTTQSLDEPSQGPGAVTGTIKGAIRELAEDNTTDVFLSAPIDKGGPFPEKYELPPLPNKRKASISSISEQPSRRTRVFDNDLDYDG